MGFFRAGRVRAHLGDFRRQRCPEVFSPGAEGKEGKYLVHCKAVLSDMVGGSHVGLSKFKLFKIKSNLKFSFLVALATWQGLQSHMWLDAAVSDGTGSSAA